TECAYYLGRFGLAFELPMFVEEVGVVDAAGGATVGRPGKVDDGPVGEFGVLERVGAVVGFAEGETGVEDYVAIDGRGAAEAGAIQTDGARVNQRRNKLVSGISRVAERPFSVLERD